MSGIDACVVFSGGLDSSVCLASAVREYGSTGTLAVTFLYGQKHYREVDYARTQVDYYGIGHKVIDLAAVGWGSSSLTSDHPIPAGDVDRPGIPSTYVPGRNLIFLSIATSIAESHGARAVITGVNAVDYSGYPDCRPEFIAALQKTVDLGTEVGVSGRGVEIKTPLIGMDKAQIVSLGVELEVPFEHTWSCYAGNDVPCRVCDSCLLRQAGFRGAGIVDPV